jgi:PhnB protein
MARVDTYLNVQGQTEEAFAFYAKTFGTEVAMLSRYSDFPAAGPGELPAEERDLVMHAELPIIARHVLMATDMLRSMGQGTMPGLVEYEFLFVVDGASLDDDVRMCSGDLDAGGFGEVPQAAGGRVPVHPGAAAVEQDRPAHPAADCPADGGRKRDQDDFGPFAAYAQDPVAMFFADVSTSGFEDPQAEQPEHRHQREVARVR